MVVVYGGCWWPVMGVVVGCKMVLMVEMTRRPWRWWGWRCGGDDGDVDGGWWSLKVVAVVLVAAGVAMTMGMMMDVVEW
ncbi:hypothetical protein Tco_0043865 [Tanacetum coccineum]